MKIWRAIPIILTFVLLTVSSSMTDTTLILAAEAGLSSVLDSDSAAAYTWDIECVHCPKPANDISWTSLQLDTEDNPHVIYGRKSLYYAWHDGNTWHYKTVVASIDLLARSLDLDADDHPHIAYTGNGLWYAQWTGSSWDIEWVDQASGSASLVLDGDGHPHIGYKSIGLKYAHWTGTDWDIQTVDNTGNVGDWTSIDLDSAGNPHISYWDYDNSALKYAHWTGSTWNIQTVDSAGSVGLFTSLKIDGSGQPHIGYQEYAKNDLKYAHWTGSTWDIQTVDSQDSVGDDLSLDLDAAGNPHMSYLDSTNGDLKYARWTGSVWDIQTVDSEDYVGQGSSLALDKSGNPHISYEDGTNGDLTYAQWTGSQWDFQIVDTTGNVGLYSSLDLDTNGNPHISYYDLTKNDLKYAHWTGSAWDIQTVDSLGEVGWDTSLSLDATGRPHICYYDATNQAIKYAYWTGNTWNIRTVDSKAVYHPSMVLDGSGRPHISYGSGTEIKYAYWKGGKWNYQTVGDGKGRTSLDLDGAGRPHIGYHDFGTEELVKYAYWTGSTWDIQTVDSAIYMGTELSLRLDGYDRPHIAYVIYDDWFKGSLIGPNLMYAHWTGIDWDIQSVDEPNWVGEYSSLVLDTAGHPHISYFDSGYTSHIKYAHWTGTEWDIHDVDTTGGLDSSLALDVAGNPHISYQHTGDLKYAHLPMSAIVLNKDATPRCSVKTGDTVTYKLTLSGAGVNARLFDPLPDNVAYVPGSVTAPAVYSSTANAIEWQGVLPTDDVQVINYQVTASATAPAIVNTAWLYDTGYARSTSATAYVNRFNVYLPFVDSGFDPGFCGEYFTKVKRWKGKLFWECDPDHTKASYHSIKLIADIFTDAEVDSPLIPVEPNQLVRVSYWVKADLEIEDATVYGKIIAAQFDKNAQEGDEVYHNQIDPGYDLGENVGPKSDWVFRSYFFMTTSETQFIRLRGPMGLLGTAKGEVWFDGVRVDLLD